MLGFFRTTVFLGWLCVALASSMMAVGVMALQATAQVAALTTQAAATALRHRQDVARAVARAKAKARIRRVIAALPLVGIGAIVYFEERDYDDWLKEHPDGDRTTYACEIAALTAEVMDETLQDLPRAMRPGGDVIASLLPVCEVPSR